MENEWLGQKRLNWYWHSCHAPVVIPVVRASGDVADASIYNSGAISDDTDTSGIATDTNGKMPIVRLEY